MVADFNVKYSQYSNNCPISQEKLPVITSTHLNMLLHTKVEIYQKMFQYFQYTSISMTFVSISLKDRKISVIPPLFKKCQIYVGVQTF